MAKVYLIGAGPGDEELITLKAIRTLKKCTAVLYDRLANDSLLKYLNEDCKIYYCGKEPGCHYKSQDEINSMLVSLAKEGHVVGRIKGGDPYVFGRGGEEALRLYDEGIEFEVIPGITSSIAVLNYAGIPVTHRGIAQSFHVFTGKSAEKLNIDWSAVSKLTGTLIFLMGLENLENITARLMENGKSEDTPCAVVMRGTTSAQRKVTGNLKNISKFVREAGLKSPCIIAVGEVVTLNEKLSWYEKKPLFGMNVCITRTKEQAVEMRETLMDLGAQVTEINTIKIADTSSRLDEYKDRLTEYDYIVFTSVNGVKLFFKRLTELRVDIRNIKAAFASIGPATTKALMERGIIPTIEAEKFVAESLFEGMKSNIKPGDKILLPRAKNARSFLNEALSDTGCLVDEAAIYETLCGDIVNTSSFDDVDVVVFTSPSTVINLISMVGIDKVRSKRVIAIGPITLDELKKNDIEAIECDEYTTEGAIKKLLEIRG